MNELRVEALLIGAAKNNQHTDDFVDNTMTHISRLSSRTTRKKHLMIGRLRLTRQQIAIAFATLLIAVGAIGFSGYAYAIGSDPISLIKRIVEGDRVKVEYRGRQFEYGIAQTYSDAAITAYAELNTVDGLAFAASNAGAIPKDGVEYLNTPYGYSAPYVYPTLGIITEVSDQSVTIRQQYTLGDKMSSSHDADQVITIPRSAELQFFANAKQSTITPHDVGRLVQLRQTQAVKHYIHSSKAPDIVTRYFVFTLRHSLDDFKAADKGNTDQQTTKQLSTSGLIEKNFGKLADRCLDNGADVCDPTIGNGGGQSLYGKGIEATNKQVIHFSEGVGPGESQPNLLLRNVYGTVTQITPDSFIIRGSSGSNWTLSFSAVQRKHFADVWGTELRLGDKVGGSIPQSLDELDSRSVATDRIYRLVRL